ncbi:hypothetical protein OKW43_005772 [Paraburkholderia sp. WC7.3g]
MVTVGMDTEYRQLTSIDCECGDGWGEADSQDAENATARVFEVCDQLLVSLLIGPMVMPGGR